MQKMMTVETSSLDSMTFDGKDLWVSDIEEKKIKRVSIAQQKVIKEIKFLPGGIPRAITFANDSLIVANHNPQTQVSSELIQINVMNGKILRTLLCPEEVDTGLIYDQEYFWGASSTQKKVVRFNPSTGEVVREFETERVPSALGWDGQNLVISFAKEGRKKTAGIAVMDPQTGELLNEEKIDVPIGGVAFAENMIFYTNSKLKEIQVTRIKL